MRCASPTSHDSSGSRPLSVGSVGGHDRKIVQNRLRETLQQSGFKQGETREELIREKVRALATNARAQEEQYWSWARKVKDCDPVFKLPKDQYEGRENREEHINRKIKEFKHQEANFVGEYQRFMENVVRRRAEEDERKTAQDKSKAKEREAAEKQKAGQLAEAWQEKQEAAKQYWMWAKEPRASTLGSNLTVPEAVNNEKEREQKIAAFARDDQKRWAEYTDWVKSIQKPTGLIPQTSKECLSPTQRDTTIKLLAEKKKKGMGSVQAEYDRWMTNLKEKHSERILKSLDDKRNWSATATAVDRDQIIADRICELKAQQKQASLDHSNFVQAAYTKTMSAPLLVQDGSLPRFSGKRHPHRQVHRRRELYDSKSLSL